MKNSQENESLSTFFMTTRFNTLIFTNIYSFFMPRLHVMTLQEISLLINTLLFFTARDEVYKRS
jgi:hypothetical protein